MTVFSAEAKEGIELDLSNGVLIHGGGWKKLVAELVSSAVFKEKLKQATGITHIHYWSVSVLSTGLLSVTLAITHYLENPNHL